MTNTTFDVSNLTSKIILNISICHNVETGIEKIESILPVAVYVISEFDDYVEVVRVDSANEYIEKKGQIKIKTFKISKKEILDESELIDNMVIICFKGLINGADINCVTNWLLTDEIYESRLNFLMMYYPEKLI